MRKEKRINKYTQTANGNSARYTVEDEIFDKFTITHITHMRS